MSADVVDALAAEREIRDLLARCARGMDRMDADLVGSCFQPAPDGARHEWPDQALADLARHERTVHTLHQILIDLRGDEARSETYAMVLRVPSGQAESDEAVQWEVVALRYLDELERRGGGPWLIRRRHVMAEWSRRRAGARVGEPSAPSGLRGRADPSYAHWAQWADMPPPPARDSDDVLASLEAERQIRLVLARYCRAVDRMDADLLRSCCQPDATHEHLGGPGSASDFVEWALRRRASFARSLHALAQSLVEVRGARAVAESSCVVHYLESEAGAGLLVAARYLDRFERRADGAWRIADRRVVHDWSARQPTGADVFDLARAGFTRGVPGRQDPVYGPLASSGGAAPS